MTPLPPSLSLIRMAAVAVVAASYPLQLANGAAREGVAGIPGPLSA